MKLHDSELERPFEVKIDGRFPYSDRALCTALIAEARAISLNATCCVLHEICRPPGSKVVTTERQRDLITEWASGFEHALKGPLLVCADALINGGAVAWPLAVAIMDEIYNFNGQRAALSVAYFSGDCDTSEGDAALSTAERRIRDAWERKSV